MAETTINVRNLIAACGSIAVFGLAFGMSYPLLALILENQGYETSLIGLNSACMPLGILVASPYISSWAGRMGSRNLAVLSALLTALIFLAFYFFNSIAAWFVLRFLQGISTAILYVLSESWIVRYAGDKHRGKVVAIYGSVLSLCFGAGPTIIGWIGIVGLTPFALASAILLLGILPILLLRESPDMITEAGNHGSPRDLLDFAGQAPMLLACVAAFGLFDAATLSLLPVYGLRSGLDMVSATQMLTVLIIGNVVLQFPIGWLADKYPARLLLLIFAGLSGVLMFALPLVVNSFLLWPVLIVMGALVYGIYTVSMVSLGQRFHGPQLVTGSAAFALMWAIGGTLGSLSGGWSMSLFGHHGLPVHLGVCSILLAFGLAWRQWHESSRGAANIQ